MSQVDRPGRRTGEAAFGPPPAATGPNSPNWRAQRGRRRSWLLLPLIALALALGACDQEQSRSLKVEKGAYKGPQDPALDESALRALRQRAQYQRGG